MLFVRRGVVVGRVASASLRPAGAASPRGGRVVLASRRSFSSSEEPFDHVKTEREIGELQRSVREALGAQDLANATEASEALMELARASYGEDRNPVLAAALNDAALCRKAAGDFERAAALLVRSVQVYESCGMKRHASTATSLHNLGVSYKEHAAQPGVRALERGLLLDRASRAVRHPPPLFRVVSCHPPPAPNHADLVGASEALEESALRREGSSGFDTKRDVPALASTKVIRASVLRLSDKPQDAYDLLDRAIADLRAALELTPVDPVRTALAAALNNKALYAKTDGDPDDLAGPLYAEALTLREAALGDAHPVVIQTLHNIAEHLDASGDDDDANAIRDEILKRLKVNDMEADESFASAARAWAAANGPKQP